VKLDRLRRPKAAYFLSYMEYRPKTNAAILWDTDHTKGWSRTGWVRQGNETKNLNLNVVDVLSVRNEYRNFKLSGATMGRELGRSE
jgi:hypothetical protein